LRFVTISPAREETYSTIGCRSWLTAERKQRLRLELTASSPGNFGDCKPLRQGLYELRIDWGIASITRCSAKVVPCFSAAETNGNSHQTLAAL
jgi:hypothetical protein